MRFNGDQSSHFCHLVTYYMAIDTYKVSNVCTLTSYDYMKRNATQYVCDKSLGKHFVKQRLNGDLATVFRRSRIIVLTF